MDAPIDTKALREAAEKVAQWHSDSAAECERQAKELMGVADMIRLDNAAVRHKVCAGTILSLCDELDRLRTEAEPVAWEGCEPNTGHSDITRRKHKADSWRTKGWFVRPLYARTEADVRVKALGWGVNGADTGLGSLYYVRHYDDGTWGWHLTMGPEVPDRYSSPGEAKAAAQADFERRVRASLLEAALQGGDNA